MTKTNLTRRPSPGKTPVPPITRYVQILTASAADIELAASQLNESAFQLQAASQGLELDPAALRKAASATHERLALVLGLALQAAASAERLNVVAGLLSDA